MQIQKCFKAICISRAKVQNLLTLFFSFLRFLHIINPWGPMHRLTKSHDPITYIKHFNLQKTKPA